jgi:DNA-binding HxlR family transcriptional regulator
METKRKTTPKGDVLNKACPSREVLAIIADKWTVLIIHALSEKTLRHNELARTLGDISQKVLTQGLRKLERNGIIVRTIYPVVPPKVEYTLSPIGRSLVSTLDSISRWAEQHFPEVLTARERFDKLETKKPVRK